MNNIFIAYLLGLLDGWLIYWAVTGAVKGKK